MSLRNDQSADNSDEPSGARFRTYERLKDYASDVEGTLLNTPALKQVIEAIYRYPLRQTATDTLNRQLRSSISNENLAALVIELWETERLCIIEEERQTQEPQIVCSLGLSHKRCINEPTATIVRTEGFDIFS